MTPRRVYVCEAQPIVLAGLRAVFNEVSEFELAGHSTDFAEVPLAIERLQPDLVLLGHTLSPRALLADLPRAAACRPTSAVVIWVHDLAELECLRALQLGARAVLRRTAGVDELLACLRTVASGQVWLEEGQLDRVRSQNRRGIPRMTPRERQIVELVCRGLKNKEIAAALSITPGTVKVHLMHIFEKTGVKDRFQLALHGRQILGGGDTPAPAPEPAVEEREPVAQVARGW